MTYTRCTGDMGYVCPRCGELFETFVGWTFHRLNPITCRKRGT